MSNLTGKQIKQLHDALLDGYNADSLRRLVRLHLDESLANIAGGATFTDLVFNLLEWAERTGRVVELMQASHQENPNNVALQTAWADLQRWSAPALPDSPTPLPPIAPTPPAHLFLSYSRADHAAMEQVRATLHAAEITTWIDHGLTPGTPNWQQAIEAAIRQTQGMVVILSPAAKASQWVNIEVSVALALQRRVFPLLVQGEHIDAVPINLFTTQFVDARIDLSGALMTKLVPALHQHLGLERRDVGELGNQGTQVTSPPAPSPLATPPTLLASLRTVLAALYPDDVSARRLVDDAGLDAARISFSGQANNTWHAIVQEADKVCKLDDLLAIVENEYGTNQPLQEALAALRRQGELSAPQHHRREPSLQDKDAGHAPPNPESTTTPPATTQTQATPAAKKPRRRSSTTTSRPQAQVPDPPSTTEQPKIEAHLEPSKSQPLQGGNPQSKFQNPKPGVKPPAIDFDWVTIPAGTFWMGSRRDTSLVDYLFGTAPVGPAASTPTYPQAYAHEMPQHQIILSSYRIAHTPVTNAQYKVFIEATKRRAPKHWNNGQIPAGKEQCPVVYMHWQDVQAFCRWISAERGEIIRLPTEAEWEKAARGTDGRIWPWGNNPPTDKLCNFNRNVGETTPVGAYPKGASPYGCLDMAGNVWEWISTLFKGYPYKSDDGREDPKEIGRHTLRGGSWSDVEFLVRCACRGSFVPVVKYDFIGFRVVAPGS